MSRPISSLDVFELVFDGTLTDEEGADLIQMINELTTPWWMRLIGRVFR